MYKKYNISVRLQFVKLFRFQYPALKYKRRCYLLGYGNGALQPELKKYSPPLRDDENRDTHRGRVGQRISKVDEYLLLIPHSRRLVGCHH